jgi:transposase
LDSHRRASWVQRLHKRSQVVRQRTTNLLSIQNLMTRNTGSSLSANQIKGLDVQQVDELLPNGDLALAVKGNLSVLCSADEHTLISSSFAALAPRIAALSGARHDQSPIFAPKEVQ